MDSMPYCRGSIEKFLYGTFITFVCGVPMVFAKDRCLGNASAKTCIIFLKAVA